MDRLDLDDQRYCSHAIWIFWRLTFRIRILIKFQVKLVEFSKTPEDFLRKYEELKSKNVRNLDPLVYLLSKLCEDKEVALYKKLSVMTLDLHINRSSGCTLSAVALL